MWKTFMTSVIIPILTSGITTVIINRIIHRLNLKDKRNSSLDAKVFIKDECSNKLIKLQYINKSPGSQLVRFIGIYAVFPGIINKKKYNGQISSGMYYPDYIINLNDERSRKYMNSGSLIKKEALYEVPINLDDLINGIKDNNKAWSEIGKEYQRNHEFWRNNLYKLDHDRTHNPDEFAKETKNLDIDLYFVTQVNNVYDHYLEKLQYTNKKYNYMADKLGYGIYKIL